MNQRIRRTALAAGALLVAAGLTSCIRVDMDIVLEDGTASGEAVLAISEDLMEMAGEESTEELFEDTDMPEGASVEPYEEDGYVGQRYVFEDADLSEFSDDDFAITYDEEAGRYEVTGEMNFESDDAAELPAGLAESFDVSLSVTFPGEVVEHNGELDGRTVTWTPAAGEVAELHAVAEEGGSGGSAWVWIVLAAVLLALGAGAAVVLVRRRSAGATGESAASDAAADDGAGGSSAAADTPSQGVGQ